MGNLRTAANVAGGVMVSLAAVAASFYYAGWAQAHSLAMFRIMIFGGVCAVFCYSFVILSKPKSQSFKVDLGIDRIVRTRSDVGFGRLGRGDIFIQASAHLHSPATVQVEYVMDLIKNGVTTHSDLIEDIGSWQIVEKKHLDAGVIPTGGLGRDVQPLPSALSVTHKADGWLHFQVANLSDLEITESLLRLTAVCQSGMGLVERDLKGTMFGPLIFRRKMRV